MLTVSRAEGLSKKFYRKREDLVARRKVVFRRDIDLNKINWGKLLRGGNDDLDLLEKVCDSFSFAVRETLVILLHERLQFLVYQRNQSN